MKKIIFILLIIHSSFIIANAQWLQQYTGTTADLYSIKFINRYTGWACGPGVILKTTNSGNNWVILNLPVSKPFFEIHPVDSNVVYCVGMFESIIKSTNGGTNWQVIRDGISGVSNSFFCCYFINQNTGWIAGGADRKILKTTNGCASFDSIVTYTSGFIKDIYFCDSLVGLYCDDTGGGIRKTTNGGYNWFSINIPTGTISYNFRNFSFINNQTGWLVVDSRKVFKTTDFGFNWDSISNIPNGSYGIHFIFFSSLNTGWTGGEGYGSMFKTTNSGVNWKEEYIPNPYGGTHSIFFTNDSIGWKVGNGGRIYHTETSGQPLMQITNSNEQIANDFILYQNYPNPFNSSTTIEFETNLYGYYNLEVFDLLGREIKTLVSEFKNAGSYIVSFNGSELASGVYFYRIQAGSFVSVKRMVLIK